MRRRETFRPQGAPITLDFEGSTVPAIDGEPVACSLLAAGEKIFSRSIKYHRPRGPYCMAAACSHCLMRVDGIPNLYTCQVRARPGMRIERQNAYPSVEVDVFGAIDWLFPRGMDHHEMFAGVPVAQNVMAKVARHLAGLGILPKDPAPLREPARTIEVPFAVVGGGVAGLAAAHTLATKGAQFYLCDHRSQLKAKDERIRTSTTALALYDDESGRFLLTVSQDNKGGPRLSKVYARKFLLAMGGHAALLPFENNDLPGIFSGRAASLLMREHSLMLGEKLALAGSGNELYELAKLVEANGSSVVALVDVAGDPPKGAPDTACHGTVIKAHGRSEVRAVSFSKAGRKRRISCDALLISLPPSPSFELARQGGAKVIFSPEHGAFIVDSDQDGRTASPEVFVAGDLVRPAGDEAQAATSGKRAAEAMLKAPNG